MKVYIDITNLMSVKFLTGIQRVVREVVVRLIRNQTLEVILLEQLAMEEAFVILNNDNFLAHFENGVEIKKPFRKIIEASEMESGAVFFDIDSAWNTTYRRSSLLPNLKAAGVKLAVYIYDIIPVTHPQYCHETTVFNFLNYLGSYLQYADAILVSAESTLDAIYNLMERLKLSHIPGYVSWLGSDFSSKELNESKIDPQVMGMVGKGRKYILSVGTIEPRKNHKLLLDAFEHGLSEMDVDLVFAGRIGWNVEKLERRICRQAQLGKTFYHFTGLNDASIDYLYKNAFLVAFPTYNEGFGLPMIEAFERGALVVASDIKVLREVGGDYCQYFNPDNPQELVALVKNMKERPQLYEALKKKVLEFQPFTWDQATKKVEQALLTLKLENKSIVSSNTEVSQIVLLSARTNDVIRTLPFIEHYMEFIEQLVLCCPDSMVDEFRSAYKGRLEVTIITDSEILAGERLPKDHQKRNLFLRCLVVQHPAVHDVFIMSDDDYRPLSKIEREIYISDGKYIGYSCYDLRDWLGTPGNMSSMDWGMKRSCEFLQEHQLPTRMYASHMPQIIDKGVYLELLQEYPEISLSGMSEWEVYFNYLQYRYPYSYEIRPYCTMCWPGSPIDWRLQVVPPEYLFENFYEGLYTQGEIFEGFSSRYYDGIEWENEKKKLLFREYQMKIHRYQVFYEDYRTMYKAKYQGESNFAIWLDGEVAELCVPEYIYLPLDGFVRIPVAMNINPDYANVKEEIHVEFCLHTDHVEFMREVHIPNIPVQQKNFELPVWTLTGTTGNCWFTWSVQYKGRTFKREIAVTVMSIR